VHPAKFEDTKLASTISPASATSAATNACRLSVFSLGKHVGSSLARVHGQIYQSKSGNTEFAGERSFYSAVAAATACIHFELQGDFVSSSPTRIDSANFSKKPAQALRCMSLNATKLPHSNSLVQVCPLKFANDKFGEEMSSRDAPAAACHLLLVVHFGLLCWNAQQPCSNQKGGRWSSKSQSVLRAMEREKESPALLSAALLCSALLTSAMNSILGYAINSALAALSSAMNSVLNSALSSAINSGKIPTKRLAMNPVMLCSAVLSAASEGELLAELNGKLWPGTRSSDSWGHNPKDKYEGHNPAKQKIRTRWKEKQTMGSSLRKGEGKRSFEHQPCPEIFAGSYLWQFI
jgi:hypothetical protein